MYVKTVSPIGSLLMFFSLFLFINTLYAQDKSTTPWTTIDETNISQTGVRLIVPQKYATFQLDLDALKAQLDRAPKERSADAALNPVSIKLPNPSGFQERFSIVEYSMMEPVLAAKYPYLKTYIATSLDRPLTTARLDVTLQGFHAMILSPGESTFIDPYQSGSTTDYIVYYKSDYLPPAGETFVELPPETDHVEVKLNHRKSAPVRSGDELRTYRLAMAATGEYTQYHGGTVPLALSAIMTTMNRINGVYEQEVAIRMVLVANTDLLIYTNGATDPYTNSSGSTMLGENQSNVTSVIGSAGYDIGHVFSTGGGGIASLESPCKTNSKARGVTGLSSPVGDPFDIDYVAHEMGHQFGGTHTWDYCGNAGGGVTDYEPGSASTIMGYAGLCGSDNIQSNSDDYFHIGNIEQIIIYTTSGVGNTCAQVTPSGNNEPSVNAGTGVHTIPISTPFKLEGSGMDPDGDVLSYCWEQYDLGPGNPVNAPTGNAPIFRSFPPVPETYRIFPQMSDIVDNTQTIGETLPTYTRGLSFRLTARDHKAGGGGVNYDGFSLSVTDQAGPFIVLHPDTAGIVWETYETYAVEWDVANTDASPVSCSVVDILLSPDGGYEYPYVLATSVPNDGLDSVEIPNIAVGTSYRIMVRAADNVFFDISNTNFEIVEGTPPPPDTPPTGINEVEAGIVLHIFPNPASGVFQVTGNSIFNQDIDLSIIDANGRLVHRTEVQVQGGAFNHMIDLTGQAKGVYVVQLTSAQRMINRKLIVY